MNKKNDDAGMPKDKEWPLHTFRRAREKGDVVEEDKKNRNGAKYVKVPILTTSGSAHSFLPGPRCRKAVRNRMSRARLVHGVRSTANASGREHVWRRRNRAASCGDKGERGRENAERTR